MIKIVVGVWWATISVTNPVYFLDFYEYLGASQTKCVFKILSLVENHYLGELRKTVHHYVYLYKLLLTWPWMNWWNTQSKFFFCYGHGID